MATSFDLEKSRPHDIDVARVADLLISGLPIRNIDLVSYCVSLGKLSY